MNHFDVPGNNVATIFVVGLYVGQTVTVSDPSISMDRAGLPNISESLSVAALSGVEVTPVEEDVPNVWVVWPQRPLCDRQSLI